MPELQHEVPQVQVEEPEWVQQLRARGQPVRRGTGEGRLNEIPNAMFPPPVHPVRRRLALMGRGIRRILGLDGSAPEGPDASFS